MKTELQNAFRSARRPRGGIAIIPAQRALANARANLALMAEAQDRKAAAEAQMNEARAIDSRRYAPGMESARDAQARADREWTRAYRLLNSGRSIRGDKMRAGHDSDKPGSVYVENPESYGFRLVGRVAADTPRGEVWDKRGDSGWFDNTLQDSLIYGLVYQLPARDGCARFVPAYADSDNPDSALIDFASMETGTRDENDSYGGARDNATARDVARWADNMAQRVAEESREYDSAWQAGSAWAQAAEEMRDARQAVLVILKERRAAINDSRLSDSGYFALCDAIRARVSDLLSDISDARARMARLADGDGATDSDYERNFWTGDKELRGAFNEGAGETVLPC